MPNEEVKLLPHQARVVDERAALDTKILALAKFVGRRASSCTSRGAT